MKIIKIFLISMFGIGILTLTSCDVNPNNPNSFAEKKDIPQVSEPFYVPEGYYYTSDHEWIKVLPDSTIQIGITSFGISNIGNVSEVNKLVDLSTNEENPSKRPKKVANAIGSLALFEFIVPIEGYMKNFNSLVLNSPNLINVAPYDNWVYSMDRFNYSHLTDSLMSASQYRSYIGQ